MSNAGDIIKRSVKIGDHATSVTLERAFWDKLDIIVKQENKSIRALISEIDAQNAGSCNLSSAIRVFVLSYYNGPVL